MDIRCSSTNVSQPEKNVEFRRDALQAHHRSRDSVTDTFARATVVSLAWQLIPGPQKSTNFLTTMDRSVEVQR
jgi:hypothetical protein